MAKPATPAAPAPADDTVEYKPAVYVPPAVPDGEEIVDSQTGKPWHLAPQDPGLRAAIYAGDVTPVARKNFKAPGTAADENPLPAA